ncbi:MAG: DUF1573 domain-containing protein [Bacteroidales bacterium]|nr:DUF1573 domain-containing protein [Bacteroidales bacterium]
MTRLLSTLILLWAMQTMALAQQADIAFETLEHDFGDIAELGGPVSFRFVYVNKGGKPLLIHSVEATCGCTSPAWSMEPVAPGQKGFVDVTFDPRERTGIFMKRVIVKSNARDQKVELMIKGTVVQRSTPLSAEFPYEMFDLRLKTPTIKTGSVKAGNVVITDIEVINPSRANLLIEPLADSLPAGVSVKAIPEVLRPGEKGLIRTEFDSGKWGARGHVKAEVPILINTYKYDLHLRGFVVE